VDLGQRGTPFGGQKGAKKIPEVASITKSGDLVTSIRVQDLLRGKGRGGTFNGKGKRTVSGYTKYCRKARTL